MSKPQTTGTLLERVAIDFSRLPVNFGLIRLIEELTQTTGTLFEHVAIDFSRLPTNFGLIRLIEEQALHNWYPA